MITPSYMLYSLKKKTTGKPGRQNDQPDDSTGEGRMYEIPESPYCPVKTFELCLSKLNPALSCLWQRPRATEILAILIKSGIVMCPSGKIR